jgi:hypothetical protein
MSKIAFAFVLLLPLIGKCQDTTINRTNPCLDQYAQEQKNLLGYEWIVLNDTISVIITTDPWRGKEDTVRYFPEENPWKFYKRMQHHSEPIVFEDSIITEMYIGDRTQYNHCKTDTVAFGYRINRGITYMGELKYGWMIVDFCYNSDIDFYLSEEYYDSDFKRLPYLDKQLPIIFE